MRPDRKKPLYRKVNTRTHWVRHGCGRLQGRDEEKSPALGQGMRQGLRHGLDYTPLYKFLLSRVGKPWDEVFSDAVARLPDEEPIWHIVAHSELDQEPIIRAGESSYYSGLYVDELGCLAKVDPDLEAETMRPACPCCTHTFNGQRFGLAFDALDGASQT